MPNRAGFSILEIAVVLSLLALALLVAVGDSSNAISVHARQLASSITTLKLESVVAGRVSTCATAAPVDGVNVHWPPRGLQFTPDGLPRTCGGGGVGNTTILLEHRGRQAAVIVSSLGRVRWELR